MNVKPDELANACAIFSVLRTDRIARHQLEIYVSNSLLLHSYANPTQIIEECISYRLLIITDKDILLSESGRQLSRRQQSTGTEISNSARDYLLQRVYLNTELMPLLCQSFFTAFRVDATEGTFIYDRTSSRDSRFAKWLRTFYRLGLIKIDSAKASIRLEYLDLFNAVLARIRGLVPAAYAIETSSKDEIGEFAEKCAVEFEIKRLQERKHHDLALLVQRISLIDLSAGYDVTSHDGTGKSAEQIRLIEVKGTSRKEPCFIWSRNEMRVAAQKGSSYWIYVFTEIDVVAGSFTGPVCIRDPIRNLAKLGYKMEALDVQVYRSSDSLATFRTTNTLSRVKKS